MSREDEDAVNWLPPGLDVVDSDGDDDGAKKSNKEPEEVLCMKLTFRTKKSRHLSPYSLELRELLQQLRQSFRTKPANNLGLNAKDAIAIDVVSVDHLPGALDHQKK